MQYRTVGNTDLRISEIGFGCGGAAGLMVRGTHAEQVCVIDRALELGINYFDESPDYGYPGVSEKNLGVVLRELGVRPIICSKIEIRGHNLDDIAGHVEGSLNESLGYVGVDYVDVLMIHNGPVWHVPKMDSRPDGGGYYATMNIGEYFKKRGALEGLDRVRRSGKARHLGFICRGNDAATVRILLDTGLFSLFNISTHLLNPSGLMPVPQGLSVVDGGNVVTYAQEKGASAAIFSPLAGGALTDNAVEGGPPHPLVAGGPRSNPSPDYLQAVAAAKKLAFLSQQGRSMAQAATIFNLMHPNVAVTLGGFSDRHQVEEIAACSGMPPLSEEELTRVATYWRANFGQPRDGASGVV